MHLKDKLKFMRHDFTTFNLTNFLVQLNIVTIKQVRHIYPIIGG